MSKELTDLLTALRASNETARKAIVAVKTKRVEMNTPQAVGMYAPAFRRASVSELAAAAHTALRQAGEQSKQLQAGSPRLAELRRIEAQAQQRRVSRSRVLTERRMADPAATRFTPRVEAQEHRVNQNATSPLLRDPVAVRQLNQLELSNHLAAELLEEQTRTRINAELQRASWGELRDRISAATQAGDLATLAAITREIGARPISEGTDRAAVVASLPTALNAIALPPDLQAEMDLLDDIDGEVIALANLRSELGTGEESAASKSRRVAEHGLDAFVAGLAADREAAAIARQGGRPIPADQPEETPAPPAATPTA
jgi:hypothetical protein